MKPNPSIGKIFGIPITIHWSFVLLPLMTLYWARVKDADLSTTLILLGLVLLIFICVVLHELGHALMAKRFGVKTKDILLLPICGMARLERLPSLPIQELLVAMAGPMVNLALALFIGIPLYFFSVTDFAMLHSLALGKVNLSNVPYILMVFNIAMVVFNLFPIFPMDGGRILRSLLAMKLKPAKATRIAAIIGQVCAILIAILGFVWNDYALAFTGLIVFYLAAREQRIITHNEQLNNTPIASIINYSFIHFASDDTIAFAQNRIADLQSKFFIVVDNDQVTGYVSGAAINSSEKDKHIVDLLSHMPVHLEEEMSMAEATMLFKEYGVPIIPVISSGQIIGTIELF